MFLVLTMEIIESNHVSITWQLDSRMHNIHRNSLHGIELEKNDFVEI